MKLLSLLHELSLHPENAEELKGLILQLAVEGKLTANWRVSNPNVETATVLLEKIEVEKQQLIADKKIKKEKTSQPIKEDEIPYELPESWAWCRLGGAGFTQTGSTPPKKNPEYYGNFIPFIGPADISNQWMKYPKEGLSEKGIAVGRLIPENSTMMVCIGGSIGKCYINEIDVSCNQQINTITPIYNLPVMIRTICQSPYFQNEVWENSSGSATPIINKGKWEKIVVPIPPLKEQKAIVEVVNALFKEVEALKELTKERISLKEDFVTSALTRLTKTDNTTQEWNYLQQHFSSFFTEKKNIKSLRETILQLAVQGKLTATWREKNSGIESAAVLVEGIVEEKAQLIKEKKIKKEKALPPIEGDIPSDMPSTWTAIRLGEIGDWGAGSTPLRSNPIYYGGEINWFKSGELNHGIMDYDSVEKITEEALAKTSVRLNKPGDVLIAMYGATIGKTGILAVTGTTNQAVCACTPFSCISSKYLHLLLKALKQTFLDQGEGGAQPNISRVKIRTQIIYLPPKEEQQAIVEKVNSLMALCDELEQQVDNSQSQIEQLMQSCLKEVFEA